MRSRQAHARNAARRRRAAVPTSRAAAAFSAVLEPQVRRQLAQITAPTTAATWAATPSTRSLRHVCGGAARRAVLRDYVLRFFNACSKVIHSRAATWAGVPPVCRRCATGSAYAMGAPTSFSQELIARNVLFLLSYSTPEQNIPGPARDLNPVSYTHLTLPTKRIV